MKILSPAGNLKSLRAAVCNGADEVYLGINDFNARNNIDGFDMTSLEEGVEFAHLHGVKVLLAVNILFSDLELSSAVKTVIDAYNLGVDAFIVQDIGLAKILKDNYPKIELHASTQMALHNLEGVLEAQSLGFKRVVLARETPLEEVRRIKDNAKIEIEYFVQGALCVSFSGNCYLSSYLNDASGNRGRCKQLCRLPYTLEENGKPVKAGYLLSAKDFNMADKLLQLQKAGVDVLKIEGRARRPFYVATATREYYNALNGGRVNQDAMRLAFNRGYTAGYLDGNGNIISNIQNHVGLKVGTVERVKTGKTFSEVFIKSTREIPKKSTLKIFNASIERSTLTAYDINALGGGIYRLTTTQPVMAGDSVNLIADGNLESLAENYNKKVKVDIEIFASVNKPISATANINGKKIEVFGEVLQQAKSQPLTAIELADNFEKSNDFIASITAHINGNVFILKKQLNQFRRDVFDKIKAEMLAPYKHNEKVISVKNAGKVNGFSDFVFTEKISADFNEKNVIYSPEEYIEDSVKKFVNACREKGKTPYLDTPNFALEKDIEIIKNIVNKTGIKVVANNLYALSLSEDTVIGGGLNVYNSHTAKHFNKPVITAESDIAKRVNFPYMTLRHCPMKAHLLANCNKCPYHAGFTYVMDSGKRLKLKRKKLSTCTFYLTD